MFEKVHVKGDDATPLYKQLAAATGDVPGWNFHKYLIDRNGKVVASFGSRVKPTDPALRGQGREPARGTVAGDRADEERLIRAGAVSP